jgi:hypothetical protein
MSTPIKIKPKFNNLNETPLYVPFVYSHKTGEAAGHLDIIVKLKAHDTIKKMDGGKKGDHIMFLVTVFSPKIADSSGYEIVHIDQVKFTKFKPKPESKIIVKVTIVYEGGPGPGDGGTATVRYGDIPT